LPKKDFPTSRWWWSCFIAMSNISSDISDWMIR
jgi:hypothetical protein